MQIWIIGYVHFKFNTYIYKKEMEGYKKESNGGKHNLQATIEY